MNTHVYVCVMLGSGLFFIAHVALHALFAAKAKRIIETKRERQIPPLLWAVGGSLFSLACESPPPSLVLHVGCVSFALDLPTYSYSLLSPLPRLGPSEIGEDGLGG